MDTYLEEDCKALLYCGLLTLDDGFTLEEFTKVAKDCLEDHEHLSFINSFLSLESIILDFFCSLDDLDYETTIREFAWQYGRIGANNTVELYMRASCLLGELLIDLYKNSDSSVESVYEFSKLFTDVETELFYCCSFLHCFLGRTEGRFGSPVGALNFAFNN